MSRLRAFALTLSLTVLSVACTPATVALTGNVPIPASSGILRVGDPAKAGEPPVLVLETTTSRSYSDHDSTIYRVVVNAEEQYSIWPEYKDIPLGWRDAGKSGPKAECLEYIKQVWTDMRPLSLRKKMDEMAKASPSPSPR